MFKGGTWVGSDFMVSLNFFLQIPSCICLFLITYPTAPVDKNSFISVPWHHISWTIRC